MEPSASASTPNLSRLQLLLQTLPVLQTTFTAPLSPTFTRFPKLPPELRNKIWRLAALEPRIIKLVPYNLPETPRIQGQQQHPGILQTCREARTEAERYYTKCLQKRNYAGSGLPRNIVYINFNVDRFHHGAYEIYAGASLDAGAGYRVRQLDDFNFKRSEILRIQRLDVELYRTYFPNGLTLARHLQPFWEHRGLEECTMKTKRYQDLQGESLGEELERNHCIEEFREIMKVHLEEQGKELNFQVKFVFRFWGNKIDLAPAPPRLPPSSES